MAYGTVAFGDKEGEEYWGSIGEGLIAALGGTAFVEIRSIRSITTVSIDPAPRITATVSIGEIT